MALTKEELDANDLDFKKVKETLFSQETSMNKNVRFVYQGKMLRDADKIKSIRKCPIPPLVLNFTFLIQSSNTPLHTFMQ